LQCNLVCGDAHNCLAPMRPGLTNYLFRCWIAATGLLIPHVSSLASMGEQVDLDLS
jgi:hypothetical protein